MCQDYRQIYKPSYLCEWWVCIFVCVFFVCIWSLCLCCKHFAGWFIFLAPSCLFDLHKSGHLIGKIIKMREAHGLFRVKTWIVRVTLLIPKYMDMMLLFFFPAASFHSWNCYLLVSLWPKQLQSGCRWVLFMWESQNEHPLQSSGLSLAAVPLPLLVAFVLMITEWMLYL